MALVKLTTDEKQGDSVPWLNEYLDSEGIDNIELLVLEVIHSAKGLIVTTREFKAFVFNNSSMFSFLFEALDAWVSRSHPAFPLYACVERRKLSFGIDTDDKPVNWTRSNKTFTQKMGKQVGDGSNPVQNPFLMLNSSPTQKTRARKTTENIDPYPNQMNH